MRVCMLAYSFYETDNRIVRYSEIFGKRGDEVDVIALWHEGLAKFERINGGNVYRIRKRLESKCTTILN